MSYYNEDLKELAQFHRLAKKICRKCYCRLPLNATVCVNKKCRCSDLRYKKCFYSEQKEKYWIGLNNKVKDKINKI